MNKAASSLHFSRSPLVHLFLIGGMLLAVSATSCRKKTETPPNPTLVFVGGEPISDSDLNQALAEWGQEMPIPKGEPLDSLKKDLLEQLIQTKTFLQEAKRENIALSKEEIDEILKKSKAEYSETEFNDLLKTKGLTYERWVKKLTENLTIQKLEEKATEKVAEPTPDEIKEYYHTHLEDYRLKPGVRIRQILLASENEAKEVHDALVKGANFAKLAAEKSISPDKDLGGDLGVLTADQMPEGFEVTLTLPVNAISPVIKTSYGFHIFRVEGKQKEKIISLNEEAPTIKTLLLQEKRDKQFARWAIDLRSKTEIKILSQSLAGSTQ